MNTKVPLGNLNFKHFNPQVLRVGDIIRVHRAEVLEYNDEPQVVRVREKVGVCV